MPGLVHRVLNADDYAMTAGLSRAIEALAAARKVSATSAMTTFARWREHAPRMRELRGEVAIGLHLNLTLGAPLSDKGALAKSGGMPGLGALAKSALSRQLDADAVRDEIRRQLDAFEQALGYPPDHVDGHQHAHVLPVVRSALLDEVAARYGKAPPLMRDPSERLSAIASNSPAKAKALTVKALAAGFRAAAQSRDLPVNASFSGFSAFDPATSFEREMIVALDRRRDRSRLKIVMCHPGHPDEELAALDPVTTRRQQEFEVLMRLAPPEATIWHPDAAQGAGRGMPDWKALLRGEAG